MATSDNEKPSRVSEEGHGRKRGREASVEPGLSQSTSGSTVPIPQKKYRVETLASIQSSRGSSPRSKDDSNGSMNNDDTVKEVRQKVEDLSHDESTSVSNGDEQQEAGEAIIDGTHAAEHLEQEAGRKRKQEERTLSSQVLRTDAKRAKDKEQEPPVSAVPSVDMDKPDQMPREASPEPNIVAPAPAKKTQATFGSFASTASPFAKIATPSTGLESSDSKVMPEDVAAKVREANTLPGPDSKATEPSTKEPAKKAQTTFGAFSATASPFSSIKHTSAFTSQPVATSSNATAHSASPFKPASGSAFGNWSTSASPFATPSRRVTPKATSDDGKGESEQKNGDEEKEDGDSKTKRDDQNFGDILAATSGEASAERQKLDVQHQQVPTGEEEENTIHSVRCKLYVMDAGTWKERGTGSLHLNVHKKDLSARLVMRAEGVFRLILNTPLYAGMKAELTDRYVKFPIVEEGKIHHIAIRTRNMDEATALHEAIERYIPAKDKSGDPSEELVGEEAV
ncbi:hypothetical protein QFC21_001321 [Naganishia friedmannii]|uniref:Uncharacterized protein n=1 Tax=Naganishia friedmannii TaxID=89922 RepID=A0ACC2W395_9TREE|nr:hypothetical protein QFC21_001321 [Naganishia friedmannii]